jgi:hypothetical protein
MKKTIRMSVDRLEGELFVLIPDAGEKELCLKKERFDISVGDVVDVTLLGDAVLSVSKCTKETKAREADVSTRLSALFAKGKKPGR